MDIEVDTEVSFNLSGGRRIVVDALELDDYIQSIWSKGKMVDATDDDGKPVMKDGQPVKVREVEWETVDKEFGAWLKERAPKDMNPPLKNSEIRGIWVRGRNAWTKKNLSWRTEVSASESPTSPPSSDPRYSP